MLPRIGADTMSVIDENDDECSAFDDAEEDEYDCGMDTTGSCAYIGSEDCDECPYRDELDN